MADITPEEIRKDIGDALSYPILTEELSYSPAAPAIASASDKTSLGRQAESAIRSVLAWRPRPGDSNGFLAALTKSFELIDREGHTEWKWTPRGFAIQADLGALTGAQASIYQRARVALEQCLKLLDGLDPLDESADPEDIAAVRTIVRTHLSDLVAELGLEGGPRIQRVDEFFHSLLEDVHVDEPLEWEHIQGQLGKLRDRFGFQSERVNSLEEEQDLTNYIVLLDYVYGLYQSWESWKAYFAGNGVTPFLGTQLIQFSRTLEVITESVHEAYFAMDSVFVGPAERQTTRLKLTQLQPIKIPTLPLRLAGNEDYEFKADIYLADLLEWVERVASVEGPRLVQDAGKDGIKAMYPILDSLRRHVRGALEIAKQDSSNPSQGFHSDRVRRALASLATQLDVATELAVPWKDAEIGEGPLVAKMMGAVVDDKVDPLSTKVTNLTNKVDPLSTTVTNLTNKVDPLSTAVTNLTNKVDPLSTTVTNLTNKVDPLSTAVTNLTDKVDPLSTAVTSLTNKVNPLSSALDKLEKRVKQLEARLGRTRQP